MSMLTEEQIAFQIILNSGNARSNIIAALRAFREQDLEAYHAQMQEAEEMLAKAHEFHFDMTQKEANGQGNK